MPDPKQFIDRPSPFLAPMHVKSTLLMYIEEERRQMGDMLLVMLKQGLLSVTLPSNWASNWPSNWMPPSADLRKSHSKSKIKTKGSCLFLYTILASCFM